MLGRTLTSSGTRGSALGSCSLDQTDDFFAARSCFGQLGLDTCFARICSLLVLRDEAFKLFLNLSVVSTGFFRRVSALCGGSGEFLLDLGLFGVLRMLLVLNLGLHYSQGLLVVDLSASLDLIDVLSLALASSSKLLCQTVLSTLLSRPLLRVATLTSELDLVDLVAGFLLDVGELHMALSLGRL